jgi:hypothetical protein
MTTRNLTASFLLALVAIVAPCSAQPPANRTHGVNLAGGPVLYDNSVLVFADLMRGAATFNWYRGVAPTPAYDANGWPTRVDSKTGSTTVIVALNANLPAGTYTLTAKGVGKVRFSGGFDGQNWRTVAFNGDGLPRTVSLATPGVPWARQIQFDVIESRADNPLRDISFWLPGHVGETFYRTYLNDLKPFSTLRFMDWQVTNGSTLTNWSDRRKSTAFSYAGRGRMEEEVACELANTLGKDAWFCIPALASDDYVRRLARLIDEHLDPELTIYVEFSNEVWNDASPQFHQLLAARAKDPQGLGGWEWIARRDGRLVNLFKSSLSPSRSCVRVLARQAGYPATLTVAVNQYKADGYGFDAFACAPYFSSRTDLNAATRLYKTDPAAAVTRVIEGLDASIAEFTGYAAWYKAQADANQVPLVLYEAGQHLVNWQDDASTPLLSAVNRDPRMGQAYLKYINSLPESIGPICWFNDCGTYSKWGYWGLKELTGRPSHKYNAVISAIGSH